MVERVEAEPEAARLGEVRALLRVAQPLHPGQVVVGERARAREHERGALPLRRLRAEARGRVVGRAVEQEEHLVGAGVVAVLVVLDEEVLLVVVLGEQPLDPLPERLALSELLAQRRLLLSLAKAG